MLKEMFNKVMHQQYRIKELQEERRAEKIVIQREKNSNERELERLMEEERQKKINLALDHYRKKRNIENNKSYLLNKGNNVIKQKNLFNSQSMILKEKKNFLR